MDVRYALAAIIGFAMFEVVSGAAAAAPPVVSEGVADQTPREPDAGAIRVRLRDGSIVTGMPAAGSLPLITAHGRLDLPCGEILELEHIVRFQHFVVRGQVDGRYTQFLRELPPSLASRFRRITRAANTVGPQGDRHKSDPWLYPIAGEGELPRIFVENGTIHCPILGTWRAVWNGVVHHYDQNRRLTRPGRHAPGPHTTTNVDYYVASVDQVADLLSTIAGEAPPRLRVELRDGSSILGTPSGGVLQLSSPWGRLSITWAQLRHAAFAKSSAGGESWYEATVELVDGDRFRGRTGVTDLDLETSIGRLAVPLGQVFRMEAVASPARQPDDQPTASSNASR
jgi:hypothetical protein